MSDLNDQPSSGPDEPRAVLAPRALAVEACVAFATALLFVTSCVLIRVPPRTRLGQISGLASLDLRFFLFGIAFLCALVLTARWREGKYFALSSRLVCAASSGVATGLLGGGILVALHGTPWGLLTNGGDVTKLAEWASALHHGEAIPPLYPPLPLHVLSIFSDVLHRPPEQAIKYLQIIGTAAFGPVAYLSWRVLLRPQWALAVGVIAAIPLIDPYKPYTNLTLVAFLPLAIWFLRVLRECPRATVRQTARTGVFAGVLFGILCLAYSGWFKWAAPGLVVSAAVVFPWREAPRKGLVLLGTTLVVFLILSGSYLAGALFDPAAKIVDKYVYFDVRVEPMYIAMWRNDLPGNFGGIWPPIGELGGVGLFTLLLTAGVGLAIALGRRSTMVIGLGCTMLGAWLWRFWYAHSLAATGLVQLYPRTTPLILYCMIALTGCGACWSFQKLRADSALRGRSAVIGAICSLLLVFASTGSSLADRYMPSNARPYGVGWLAWNAQEAQRATEHKPYPVRVMSWVRRDSIPVPTSVAAPQPSTGSATPR